LEWRTSLKTHKRTYGFARKAGGLKLPARPGDGLVIPAGVAHKIFIASTCDDSRRLTPDLGRGIEAHDPRAFVENVRLEGFTMLGAYPNEANWNFAVGSEDHSDWLTVWSIPLPKIASVMG
jgi:uncharacterized protein YjlB